MKHCCNHNTCFISLQIIRDYSTVRAQKREKPAPDVCVLLQIRTLGKR
jgi:hypothetical protein